MRKGVGPNEWSVSEERYLIENAGRIPKRDICKHLKRSSTSMRGKAQDLRRHGVAVDLRCYISHLEPCPSCGCMSGRLGKYGICEPCRRREQLATIHARIAELWPLLSVEDRDTYEKTEAETESSRDPFPPAPDTRGLSYYARAKAEEAHALACETVLTNNLRREVKAAQKRKERIEKKIKSM